MVRIEISSPEGTQVLELDKDVVSVGREADNDIIVQDVKCSRHHCRLQRDNGSLVLHDLGSRNGTRVGRAKVHQAKLTDGGAFHIGKTKISVFVRNPVACSAPMEPIVLNMEPASDDTPTLALKQDQKQGAATTPAAIPATRRELPKRSFSERLEMMMYLQSLLKTAAAVLLLAGTVGGYWWYRHDQQVRIEKENHARLESRAALETRAITEMNDHISNDRFQNAKDSVTAHQNLGLEAERAAALYHKIDIAARERGSVFVNEAEAAVASADPSKAEDLLRKAGDLSNFGFNDSRIQKMQERIAILHHERRSLEGREELKEALALLDADRFDEALAAKQKALGKIPEQADRDLVERQFHAGIGARARFVGLPPGASITIQGREDKTYHADEMIAGLPDGELIATIRCADYVNETATRSVRYPDAEEIPVPMIRRNPGWLWSASAFAAMPCSSVVGAYYKKSLREPERTQFLSAFPALERPRVESAALLSDSALKEELGKLRLRKLTRLERMNLLGEVALRSPRGMSMVLEAEGPFIRGAIKDAETGCFDCQGGGFCPCSGCGAKGKEKRQTDCKKCQNGLAKCWDCKGSGWVDCRKCGGTGFQGGVPCPVCLGADIREKTRVKVHGEGSKTKDHTKDGNRTRKEEREKADVEGTRNTRVRARTGRGQLPCACDDGVRPCPDCNGAGEKTAVGKCSKCQQTRQEQCRVCGGKGRREDMDLKIWKERELAIAQRSAIVPQTPTPRARLAKGGG